MKRTKKPKSRPKKDPVDIVMDANYLNMSIFFITLNRCHGFGKKRLSDVLESYLALMDNIADKRMTVKDMRKWCQELTGIEVHDFLTDVMENNYDGWTNKVEQFRQEAQNAKTRRLL